MAEERNAHTVSARKLKGKRILLKAGCRWVTLKYISKKKDRRI
jgi:hypothetical protein